MENYDEISQNNTKEKIQARKIFENDYNYFHNLSEQCTNETLVEKFECSYSTYGSKFLILHYLLPNGLHFYKLPGITESICSSEEIPSNQLEAYFKNDNRYYSKCITGSYVVFNDHYDDSNKSIKYVTHVGGQNAYAYPRIVAVRKDSISGDINLKEIPDYAESGIHVINSSTQYFYSLSEGDKELAKSRFSKVFAGLEREDLAHYSDEEILIMQLRRRTQELESDLESQKTTSKEAEEQSESEKAQLRAEND